MFITDYLLIDTRYEFANTYMCICKCTYIDWQGKRIARYFYSGLPFHLHSYARGCLCLLSAMNRTRLTRSNIAMTLTTSQNCRNVPLLSTAIISISMHIDYYIIRLCIYQLFQLDDYTVAQSEARTLGLKYFVLSKK